MYRIPFIFGMYFRNPRLAEMVSLQLGVRPDDGMRGLSPPLSSRTLPIASFCPAAENAVIIYLGPQTPCPPVPQLWCQRYKSCRNRSFVQWDNKDCLHFSDSFFFQGWYVILARKNIHSPSEGCKCPFTAQGLITDNHFMKENIRPRIDAAMQRSCCASLTFYRSFANIALLWCQ